MASGPMGKVAYLWSCPLAKQKRSTSSKWASGAPLPYLRVPGIQLGTRYRY